MRLLQTALIILLLSACTTGIRKTDRTPHPVSENLDTNVILPPSWAFGVLYGGYTDQQESLDRINKIIDNDLPIDAYWIDSWFWNYTDSGAGPSGYVNFIGDTIAFPDMKEMWDSMKEKHVKSGIWIWDIILKHGNEEVYNDFKSKGYFLSTERRTNDWHNAWKSHWKEGEPEGTRSGEIDFDNPEAFAYFKQQIKPFFERGVDFMKLDKTTEINYLRAVFEASQQYGNETGGRGFILSHAGHETEKFKRYPCKWTGDTQIAWSHPTDEGWPSGGLKENIEMVTDTAGRAYDIPFVTCDAGGYSFGHDEQHNDNELYIRWIQFGAFLPIMEVFSASDVPHSNMPFKVSERANKIFKNITHLRTQLFPYIYSYAHKCRHQGRKMIRNNQQYLHQYKFGDEILVAPVCRKGDTTKDIYLPEGNRWVNYHTGEVYEGGKQLTVAAPLNQIPLMIRKGAIIPMRRYARAIEMGSNDPLILHIYPDTHKSTFTLYEDDGITNDYLNGIYASTLFECIRDNKSIRFTINPVTGYYENMPAKRSYILKIHTIKKAPEKISFQKETIDKVKNKESFKTVNQGWYIDTKNAVVFMKFDASKDKKSVVTIDTN